MEAEDEVVAGGGTHAEVGRPYQATIRKKGLGGLVATPCPGIRGVAPMRNFKDLDCRTAIRKYLTWQRIDGPWE